MSILHVPVTASNLAEWVRRAAGAINQLITGKQDQSDNLTSIAGLDLTGHAGDVVTVLVTEDGFELAPGGGVGGGLSDGDYGDVTVSGSGTVINIDAGVVTTTELGGDITTAGKALLDDADATAQRSTLGLGTIATQSAASVTISGGSITGITDLAVADGGTGASNAAGARTNLGLVIGTDVLGMGGGTLTGDLSVPDEAYDATNWNGSVEVPTKNAVRDKIESMAGGSRVLITETVTTGSATNVSFTSIPGTYRDLEIRVRGRGTKSATLVDIRVRFNSDSGGNYDIESNQVNGTSNTRFTLRAQTSGYLGNVAAATATASVADFLMATIADYRGTTFQKAALGQASLKTGTGADNNLYQETYSLWWRSTSAITQIDVFPSGNGFVDGSIVSLYGLM